MSNLADSNSSSASSFPMGMESLSGAGAFVDRRSSGQSPGVIERRQFGSTHSQLSAEGRELALAIDQYKLQHRRRYITCDEMLTVMHQLGYQKR